MSHDHTVNMMSRQTTALYAGTFDPFTNGHLAITERGAKIFHRIIIGVSVGTGKSPLLTFDQRVRAIEDVIALRNLTNVSVITYSKKLTVDVAREHGASVLLRGIRTVNDHDSEQQLAGMNQTLASDIDTVVMYPTNQFAHVSSTLVREIAKLGGDITPYVPQPVARMMAAVT